ncbi:MAG: helix-turn-helix domain-containing protein [Mycobacteriales bacterium]
MPGAHRSSPGGSCVGSTRWWLVTIHASCSSTSLQTREMVRELIRREFGVGLSAVSVGRLLRQIGLSPQRPIWRAWQADPEAVSAGGQRAPVGATPVIKGSGAVGRAGLGSEAGRVGAGTGDAASGPCTLASAVAQMATRPLHDLGGLLESAVLLAP